jgi:hypothetical protein
VEDLEVLGDQVDRAEDLAAVADPVDLVVLAALAVQVDEGLAGQVAARAQVARAGVHHFWRKAA